MDEVRLVGEIGHRHDNRKLYLAVVHDLPTWSPDLRNVPTPFTAFTTLDVKRYDMETLQVFGAKLIAAGCRDFQAWGADSEALEAALDHAFVDLIPEDEWDDKLVMTGGAEEDFDEALDYALFN